MAHRSTAGEPDPGTGRSRPRGLSGVAVNVQGMGDGLVQARGLRKSFGAVEAVRGIDVDVARGEAFGFLGPNGAGKSSTMRMIACVSPRTGGELSVLGLDPGADGPRIRARIGVVPQLDNLDAELTVRENLEVYGRYFGLPRARVRAKAAELLEFAQLTERADEPVEPLSGGMKRRLTIARSLVNDPELLLLDEPTTGLDPQARHLLWDRLFRLKREGVTLIITTHYMDEAEQLCDRLVVMDGGLIVAEGSPGRADRPLLHQGGAGAAVRPGARPRGRARSPALAERVEELPDRLLLYTDDGERAAGRGGRGRAAADVRAGPPVVAGGRVPAADRPDAWWTDGAHRDRPRRRTAAPPTFAGGVLLVVEHYWIWYRRNWRATAVSSVLQPLLFLLAFGVGFGSLVDGTGRAAEATGGVDYLVWLAPALLARVGGAERRRSSRPTRCCPGSSGSAIYHAMTAGPISPAQVARRAPDLGLAPRWPAPA